MVVVARIPRIEPEDPGCFAARDGGAAPGGRADASPCPAPPLVAEVAPSTPRGRGRPSARFPTLSTLFLAVFAGACWLAVWRQDRLDRHRSASALAGDERHGDIAAAPEVRPDLHRSVAR